MNTPENTQKLTEAKENSGNEMLKMMQFVFPIVVQIEMDVIKNYGFSESREGKKYIFSFENEYNFYYNLLLFLFIGTVQFVKLLRTLEREDPEVAQLHSQVRSYFLPPVLNSHINCSTEASL